MQIFSKLQRNSTYKTFIKIILIFLINSLSSFYPFFPILIGFFLFCDEIFFSVLYICFFSILHSVNIFYLLFIYLILRLFLYRKIVDYINYEYQSIIYVLIIYIALFIYFINFINVRDLLIYLLFNFSFDILLIKVFRCEAKLL
jgi:hypothetical protein